jgi:hypothetical protein
LTPLATIESDSITGAGESVGFQNCPDSSCSTVKDRRVLEIEDLESAKRIFFPAPSLAAPSNQAALNFAGNLC